MPDPMEDNMTRAPRRAAAAAPAQTADIGGLLSQLIGSPMAPGDAPAPDRRRDRRSNMIEAAS